MLTRLQHCNTGVITSLIRDVMRLVESCAARNTRRPTRPSRGLFPQFSCTHVTTTRVIKEIFGRFLGSCAQGKSLVDPQNVSTAHSLQF